MAQKKRIGKSKTIAFRIVSLLAVEAVVVFSGQESGTVYAQFAYPSRSDFEDLDYESSGGVFTAVLPEEATQGVADDILVADVKVWADDGQNKIKRYRILPLASTEVENIDPITTFP